MKKELWDLAVWGIKGRKRSSILLLIVLFLSFSAAVVTLSVTGSLNKTNEEYRFDMFGTWYGAILNAQEDDGEMVRQSEWLDKLGVTESYGVISTVSGQTGIGTIDDVFREIGRISLQDGDFPQNENEIAMEASLLSALGYDYELGQEIAIQIGFYAGDEMLYTEQTYTLCGVLRAYTKLWTLPENSSRIFLNGAVVTQEAARKLAEAAKVSSAEWEELTGEILVPEKFKPGYYFTVKEGMEQQMEEQVNRYLLKTRMAADAGKEVWLNQSAYMQSRDASYQYLYVTLVFAVTLLAVVCIYTIQIQKQVRQIALFRSIGITKRQLRRMMFYETLCISLPAAGLGIIVGSLGIRILLWMVVYAGSVPVRVIVPWKILIPLILVWILGIFFVRMLIFQLALKQPLTGRLAMEQKKARRSHMMRKTEILLLFSLLCGTVFFTLMESLYDIYNMNCWKNEASYIIHSESAVQGDKSQNISVLSKERLETYRRLPGVDWMNGYDVVRVKLEFEGSDACEYFEAYDQFYKGENYNMYAIPEELWKDFFGKDLSEIDVAAFRDGDQILLSFPVNIDGEYILYGDEGRQKFEDIGIREGDKVTLHIDGMKIVDDELKENKDMEPVITTVGSILCCEEDFSGMQGARNEPYLIICSEQFLNRMMEQMEPDYICSNLYKSGESVNGYTMVLGAANLNAGYLSTDYVLAAMCAEDGLMFYNNREIYASYMQEHVQSIILLYASGSCIILVLLFIVGNALVLEAQTEKRKYGILQAIGMSVRQAKGEILKKSICCSVIAAGIGWGIYGCYILLTAWQRYQEFLTGENAFESFGAAVCSQVYGARLGGADIWFMLMLTGIVIAVMLLVWRLAKRSLFRDNLMEKLQDRN